jgi:cell division protein FtsQ
MPSGLKITTLEVDNRLTARLRLNSGVLITVDREQYATKLRRFLNLYESVLSKEKQKVERVDLRYGDAVAVTWQKDTKPPAKERV